MSANGREPGATSERFTLFLSASICCDRPMPSQFIGLRFPGM
jgi:hypothetical protein